MANMTNQVQVLRIFGLLKKLIAYVKIEISQFKYLNYNFDKCNVLYCTSISMPICRVVFGHTMSKVAQHATNYFKFYAIFLEGA
jgi:hypothetical protein